MKRIKVILGSLVGALAFLPALAFAQGNFNLSSGGITGVLGSVGSILNMIVPILIALGIIAFLWGVLRFIFSAGDEEKRKAGKMFMIYGIIGIVVMVSVWGLVAFIQKSFGIQSGTVQNGPQLPTVPGY